MAGAGYLPVDPEAPFARKKHLLKDSDAIALIASEEIQDCQELASSEGLLLLLADPSSLSFVASPQNHVESFPQPPRPGPGPTSSSLAMLMYTSGTSGVPKGIIYDHRHLLHGTWFWAEMHQMNEKSVQLLKSPYFWAVMEWEFFPALLRGGSVVVASPDGHKQPEYMADVIRRFQVNLLMITPSVLELMLDVHQTQADLAPLQSLQQITTVGEAFPSNLANRLVGMPDISATVRNVYGASESSCTVYTVPRAGVDLSIFPKRVPAGFPQEHAELYIMAVGEVPLRLVNPGEAGEICFGGVVAAGYFKLPQLTEEKFVKTQFGRLYKTGDLGRWNNGCLEVTGRIDRQVKVRGVRVDPEEIEAVLRNYQTVKTSDVKAPTTSPVAQVAVVASSEPSELVAFVVPRANSELDAEDLKIHCRATLAPAYLPKHVLVRKSLPALANGKVNLMALQKAADEVVDLLGAETVEDSLGRMKSLSKDALMETAVIHRCYAFWMVGVMLDHVAKCSTPDVPDFCEVFASARLQPWTELLIRSFGNIQCMLGFILLGAFQESRAGARIKLGWVDVYMLAVSMAIILPLPQVFNFVFRVVSGGHPSPPGDSLYTSLGWDVTYMRDDSDAGHARWYLNVVVLSRVFVALCQSLRVPAVLQVLLAGSMVLVPRSGDVCKMEMDPTLQYFTVWLWGCTPWEPYIPLYICWYTICLHCSRPCLKMIQALAPRGPVWASVATAISMVLGLLLAQVDYPNVYLSIGIVTNVRNVWLAPLYVLQIVLFALGAVYWPVDARLWGNTTLGMYVTQIFLHDWLTYCGLQFIAWFAWDPTGLLLYFAMLLMLFAVSSTVGPVAHYVLTTPQRLFRNG